MTSIRHRPAAAVAWAPTTADAKLAVGTFLTVSGAALSPTSPPNEPSPPPSRLVACLLADVSGRVEAKEENVKVRSTGGGLFTLARTPVKQPALLCIIMVLTHCYYFATSCFFGYVCCCCCCCLRRTVVANYAPKTPHCLKLEFGQHIQLVEHCGGWYRGRFLTRGAKLGIFPKNHVALKKCKVTGPSGQFETVEFEEDQLAHEIAEVVREWGRLLLIQFEDPNRSDHRFTDLRATLMKLITYRREILAGTLPHDKLYELKSRVSYQIDTGNRELRLDYMPRDDLGLSMSVKTSTVMELFKVHRQQVKATRKQSLSSMSKMFSSASLGAKDEAAAMQLFFKHDKFEHDIGEQQEIYYSLYDATPGQETFTNEPFVVHLDKSGSLPKGLPNNPNMTTCLFSDVDPDSFQHLHLVATVVRLGAMEDGRVQRYEASGKQVEEPAIWLRRPVARGVVALTNIGDVAGRGRMQLYKCGDDIFSQLHQRIITKDQRLDYQKTGKEIVFSCNVLNGTVAQVKRENPLLFERNTGEAPRGRFPDFMKPDDQRNDLYVTVSKGEFDKTTKSTPRNIEAALEVLLDSGEKLANCIIRGSGLNPCSEYFSVIYYHNNSPEWNETVKLVIPEEHYGKAHLRFSFRHCSSKDVPGKKKADIFCFAFKPLVDNTGAGIKDGTQNLTLYKYDHKLYAADPGLGKVRYLAINAPLQLHSTAGKDSFMVQALSCSTSQLQDRRLIQFFSPNLNPANLDDILMHLGNGNIDGIEIVKKLEKTFDELFGILRKCKGPADQNRQKQVIAALMRINGLLAEPRFKFYKPELDKYIESRFNSPEVHVPLIEYVKQSIRPEIWQTGTPGPQQKALETMKALEPVFKFIVRSRELQHKGAPGDEDSKFKAEVTGIIEAFGALMVNVTSPAAGPVQTMCLRHFAVVFDEVAKFFNPDELGRLATGFLMAIRTRAKRTGGSGTDTLDFIGALVESSMFKVGAARRHILPEILQFSAEMLEDNMKDPNADGALRIVASMVGNLEKDQNSHDLDVVDVSTHLLKPLLEIVMNGRDANIMVLSCLLAVLRMMSAQHWDGHLSKLPREKQEDFLVTTFNAFLKLCPKQGDKHNRVFEPEWRVMIMLKNETILQAVQSISVPLRKLFLKATEFKVMVWRLFFKLASNYMCQESLKLESFSVAKREAIFEQHGDKRVDMAKLIRELWYTLDSKQRLQFIPEQPKAESVLGWFQEAALVPEAEARTSVIHIFFDMMEIEATVRGNFVATERDMTDKLDQCIQKGLGDLEYKVLFEELVNRQCRSSSHKVVRANGPRMITNVTSLLDSLLALRYVPDGPTFDDWRAGCMYNLLRYYKANNRLDIAVRAVHKLTDILIRSQQFTEAGFALKIHAEALKWTSDVLPPMTDGEVAIAGFPQQTESQRKEMLYQQIIQHFSKGDTWENALPIARDLAQHYMDESFEYDKLSKLHTTMAELYRKIAKEKRREPQYFKVAYYGKTMPREFQNKQYIYRGWKTDHISTFCERIRNQFPTAELIMQDKDPTEKMINDPEDTYIMICKVEPIPDAAKLAARFKGRQDKVPAELRTFANYNDVSTFTYKRQFRKGAKTSNEFETLWVINFSLITEEAMPATLGRVLVKDCEKKEISPIENAIIAMSDKNVELMALTKEKQDNPHVSVNPLSMVLSGVIDAAVMGGTDKYREAFFKPTYLEENASSAHFVDTLRKLIGKTVTICEIGLMVHKMHCPSSLQEKQKLLETQLETMKKKADADRTTGATTSPSRPPAGSNNATPLNPFSSSDPTTGQGDGDDAPPPPPRPPKPSLQSDDASEGANPFEDAPPPVLPPRRPTVSGAPAAANMSRRLSASFIVPPNSANPFPTEVEKEIQGPTESNPFSTLVEAADPPAAEKPKPATTPSGARKPNPFAKKKAPAPAPAPKAAPKLLQQDFDSSSDDDESDDEDEDEPNPFAAALASKPAPKLVPPRPTSSKPPPVVKKKPPAPTQKPK
jgi:hypothetical protein